jgi:hypothetical protein
MFAFLPRYFSSSAMAGKTGVATRFCSANELAMQENVAGIALDHGGKLVAQAR